MQRDGTGRRGRQGRPSGTQRGRHWGRSRTQRNPPQGTERAAGGGEAGHSSTARGAKGQHGEVWSGGAPGSAGSAVGALRAPAHTRADSAVLESQLRRERRRAGQWSGLVPPPRWLLKYPSGRSLSWAGSGRDPPPAGPLKLQTRPPTRTGELRASGSLPAWVGSGVRFLLEESPLKDSRTDPGQGSGVGSARTKCRGGGALPRRAQFCCWRSL